MIETFDACLFGALAGLVIYCGVIAAQLGRRG